jgi:hypothetical protein
MTKIMLSDMKSQRLPSAASVLYLRTAEKKEKAALMLLFL